MEIPKEIPGSPKSSENPESSRNTEAPGSPTVK
jgi:hypothetical protein